MAKHALTEEEQHLLTRHFQFYRDLATGKRKPITPAQKHFVDVTVGRCGAETPHEMAYMKLRRLQAAEREQEDASSCEARDPRNDGPTEAWFTREDWKRLRSRQRFDGSRS